MSIPTGRYIITNVRQKNSATLKDPNDGTPVTAGVETYMDISKWNVVRLDNGRYTLQSVGSANYANTGGRAPVGTNVEGRSRPTQFDIRETRVRNQYMISTTDTQLCFSLMDGELQSSITLSDRLTDDRSWWTFTPSA